MSTQPHPYVHLIRTDWDANFLNNDQFRVWFAGQLVVAPLPPNQPLVEYVRQRIATTKAEAEASAASTAALQLAQDQAAAAAAAQAAAEPSPPAYVQPAFVNPNALSNPSYSYPSQQPSQQQQLNTYFGGQQLESGRPHSPNPQVNMAVDPSLLVASPSSHTSYGTNGTLSTLQMQRQLVQNEQLRQQQLLLAQQQQQQPVLVPAPEPTTVAPKLSASKPPAPKICPRRPSPPPATPWRKISPTLSDLLTHVRLSRAALATATRLSTLLTTFSVVEPATSAWGDGSDVPPEGRVWVLKEMLRYGEEEWWKAMVGREGEGLMKVLREWLLGASSAKESGGTAGSLVLLLQVFGKLPLVSESLGKYKIAPRVKRVSEKSTDPQAAAVAKELMGRWEKMVSDSLSARKDAKPDKDSKRKAVEASDGAKKKAKVVVKPESKASTSAAAPAAKKAAPSLAALPSFKKEKKPDVSPTAVDPSNPFHAALSSIGRKKEPVGKEGLTTSLAPKGKEKKVRKSVRWAEGAALEMVKIIEKAIYDGDEERSFGGEGDEVDVRMMEEQEGLTHTMHMEEEMEEELEWYQPVEIIVPNDADFKSFHTDAVSLEVLLQTAREAGAMVIDYPNPDDAPLSPAEPPPYTIEDPPTLTIQLPAVLRDDPSVQAVIAIAQSSAPPTGGFAANDQISSLLGQLSATGFGQQFQQAPVAAATSQAITNETMVQLRHFDPALIESILQQNPALGSQLGAQLGNWGVLPPSQLSAQEDYNQKLAQYQLDRAAAQPGYGQPPHNGWGAPPVPSAWDPNGQQQQPYMANQGWNPPPEAQALGRSKRGSATKGRSKKERATCRFFNAPKGCDWGTKCFNIHDRDGTGDVRER